MRIAESFGRFWTFHGSVRRSVRIGSESFCWVSSTTIIGSKVAPGSRGAPGSQEVVAEGERRSMESLSPRSRASSGGAAGSDSEDGADGSAERGRGSDGEGSAPVLDRTTSDIHRVGQRRWSGEGSVGTGGSESRRGQNRTSLTLAASPGRGSLASSPGRGRNSLASSPGRTSLAESRSGASVRAGAGATNPGPPTWRSGSPTFSSSRRAEDVQHRRSFRHENEGLLQLPSVGGYSRNDTAEEEEESESYIVLTGDLEEEDEDSSDSDEEGELRFGPDGELRCVRKAGLAQSPGRSSPGQGEHEHQRHGDGPAPAEEPNTLIGVGAAGTTTSATTPPANQTSSVAAQSSTDVLARPVSKNHLRATIRHDEDSRPATAITQKTTITASVCVVTHDRSTDARNPHENRKKRNSHSEHPPDTLLAHITYPTRSPRREQAYRVLMIAISFLSVALFAVLSSTLSEDIADREAGGPVRKKIFY